MKHNHRSRGEKKDMEIENTTFQNPPRLAEYDGAMTLTSIFNLFFDDAVIQMIVDITNLYVHRIKGILSLLLS